MKLSKEPEDKGGYFVPLGPSTGHLREKASRFLAFLYPAADPDTVNNIRKDLQKEYHDASHHCYAFRLGVGGGLIERCSDAGEPSRTAGEPILNAMREASLTNALLVVVRYFGGTKLGTGGLVKAYRESALSAIGSAKLEKVVPSARLDAEMPFAAEGSFRYHLARAGGRILEEKRGEEYHSSVEVPVTSSERFEKTLKELGETWKNTLRWKWR